MQQQDFGSLWLDDIFFADHRHGWIVGVDERLCIQGMAATHGSGSRATQRTSWTAYFLDTNEGWVAGGEGVVLHTTDGGRTGVPNGVTLGMT